MKVLTVAFRKKKFMEIYNVDRELWSMEWVKIGLLAITEIGADFYVYFE